MSLAGYQPPVKEITLGGQSVKFAGLSLNAVSTLIQSNLDDAENLFNIFDHAIGNGANLQSAQLTALAVKLAEHAPKFTAATIALAAVEDTELDVRMLAASKISAPLQIDLLVEIGKLTFEEVGGVGKFLASVGALMTSLKSGSPAQLKKVVGRKAG